MRVVLDTNVLVSALLFGGKPSRIVKLAKDGLIELVVSPFILTEFEEKLKSKFGYSTRGAREAGADIEVISRLIHPKSRIHVIQRKDSDNRILECAVDAGAQALVTGNMKDLRPLGSFQGVDILTPAEFLSKYPCDEV